MVNYTELFRLCMRIQEYFGSVVYISCAMDIFPVEVDIVNFRYFDATGKQLTNEQLKAMNIVTPAMEHVFATVADRIEESRRQSDGVENSEPK